MIMKTMKKFFFLFITTLVAVASFAQDNDGPIMEQPEGTLKQYERLGGANRPNAAGTDLEYLSQSGYAYIVFTTNGTGVVYLKDPLCYYNKGSWVRGQLSADKKTITVPTGQKLYTGTTGVSALLELADVSGTHIVYNEANTEIVYTIDDNVIHLRSDADAETHVIAAMRSDTHAWMGYAEWSTSYIDSNYNPDSPDDPTNPNQVVTPPADLVPDAYLYMGKDLSFGADGKVSGEELFETDAYIGFKDDKVYIQGMSSVMRQAWVEGTVSGNTITIPAGQYQGAYSYNSYDYPIFIIGANAETEAMEDLVFNYDSESGTIELKEGQWIVDNSDADKVSETVFAVISDAIFIKAGGETPEPEPEPDVIKSAKTDISHSSIYNLQGQKVDKPTKGIFVKNGKKIVVK